MRHSIRWTGSRRTALIRGGAAIGTLALAIGLAGCNGAGSSSGDGDSTLTLATGATLGFDPADAQPGYFEQYLQPVYDPLIRLDPSGEPTPNVATDWSYDESLTTLTIDLRTDVTFSDGTPLDAEAVKGGLEHTKGGTSTTASQLAGVESIEVVDADTVELHLTAPDPSLLPNLGKSAGMIASPAGIAAGTLKADPQGSGPYTLDPAHTTEGDQYTFVRNKEYWNADAFPYDTVVLKVLTDTTAILNALRSGQIDGGPLTTSKDAETAEKAGLSVVNYPNGDLAAVYFYDKAGSIVPALADPRVRQAINHALDRDAIVSAGYGDTATPTEQMFSISTDDGIFDDSLDDAYPYDPEKAKELLAEAGYPDGFTVTMPDWSAYAPEINAEINQNLADIGITVVLDTLPTDQLYANTLQGKYAMGWQPYDDNRPWDLIQFQLLPDSPWNPLHYEDQTVTDLVAKIQSSTGDEQKASFRELNEHLVETAWSAPINAVTFNYATSKAVEATPEAFQKRPPLYNYRPAE
jgi:peptide/nickel transport system substrate-binding protein